MSDWTDEVKRRQAQEADAERVKAEAEVYRNRKFQTLVPDWWDALKARLKTDAANLNFSLKESPSFVIERTSPEGVTRLFLEPKPAAERVRIVFSHSRDHIDYREERVSEILLRLNDSDRIEASIGGHTFFTIDTLSECLLGELLNWRLAPRLSPWS